MEHDLKNKLFVINDETHSRIVYKILNEYSLRKTPVVTQAKVVVFSDEYNIICSMISSAHKIKKDLYTYKDYDIVYNFGLDNNFLNNF